MSGGRGCMLGDVCSVWNVLRGSVKECAGMFD